MGDAWPSPKTEIRLGRPAARSRRRGRWLQATGLLLLLLALLLGVYGTTLLLALDSGQRLRQDRALATREAQLARQLELAAGDVNDTNYGLALRRLDWVLAREPAQPAALGLRATAEAGLNRRLTPTATPRPEPTATINAQATPDPGQDLRAVTALVDDGEWAAAIPALIAFQTRYPGYQRRLTDTMLFEAYIAHGVNLTQGRQIELGLFYIDRAERLGNLPQAVQDQRVWAELYLNGIAFYGVDWAATVFYFRDLCRAAPFYQDACGLLYESLIAYGNVLANAGDWCPAEPLYREASRYDSDEALRHLIADARAGCLEATPTPGAEDPAVITDTIPLATPLP